VSLGRRALVLGSAAAVACSRGERNAQGGLAPAPPAPPADVPATTLSASVRTLEWDLGAQPWGSGRAAVVVPNWGGPSARFPVLVALHGRGEALKPPAEGALGWPHDYALVRAFDRLRSPPLTEADYEGLVDPPRMAEANSSLARHPLDGLVVVCPWLPDVRPAATADIAGLTRFVLDVLLPRVRSETPALTSPEATGIDGVSLGGVLALRIGLASPQSFGAVGGIQPALSDGAEADWTALAQHARAARPGMRLHLLTSHQDYFRDAIVAASRAWQRAGIAHDFADVVGPHDYIFNRGPGSIELLLWHDRALRRA